MVAEETAASASPTPSVSIEFSGTNASDFPRVRGVQPALDLKAGDAGEFWVRNERAETALFETESGTTPDSERRHLRVNVPVSQLPVAFSVGSSLYIVHESSVHILEADRTRRYTTHRSSGHDSVRTLQVDPFDQGRDVEVTIQRR